MEEFKYPYDSPKEQERIFKLIFKFTDELIISGATEEEKWRAYYLVLDPDDKLESDTKLTLKLVGEMQELSRQGVPINVIKRAIEDTYVSEEEINKALENIKKQLDEIDKKIGD